MKTAISNRVAAHAIWAVLLGLAVGYFLARTSLPLEQRAATADLPTGRLVSSNRERQPRDTEAGIRLRSHTLEAVLHLDWRRVWLNDLDRQLAVMEVPQLKRLLAASDADRFVKYSPGYAAENLRRRLIREIYQREREGAVGWAAEQSYHPEVFGEFVALLARDDLAAALAWRERLLGFAEEYDAKQPPFGDFTKHRVFAYWQSSIQFNAASQGEEAVLKVNESLGTFSFSGGLPTDFDHPKMVGRMGAETLARCTGLDSFLQSWAGKDKDAAFACATDLDQRQNGNSYLNLTETVFRAARYAEGEANAAKWLADQLADEPPERRAKYLLEMGRGLLVALSPSGFGEIMDGLRSEEDRSAYLAGYIGSSQHDPWLTMAYLEEFGPIETQAAALERAAILEAPNNQPVERILGARQRYDKLTSKPGFPPEVRARILAALSGP